MIRTTLITTVLIVGLGATVALADRHKNGERHHSAERFEYIFDQMDLGEQQREEVITIMRDFAQERRDHWRERRTEKGSESSEAPRRERLNEAQKQELQERREQAREQHRAELGARLNQVLAADQVEQLMTYMEAHRPNHRGPGSRKGGNHSNRGKHEGHRQ